MSDQLIDALIEKPHEWEPEELFFPERNLSLLRKTQYVEAESHDLLPELFGPLCKLADANICVLIDQLTSSRE